MTEIDTCKWCGDSGVLHIIMTLPQDSAVWDHTPYASPCHACEPGKAWTEAGLG